MELELQGNNDLMIISITGDLLSTNCYQLRETILQLSERNINNITINLEKTPFIDSAGLGVLVGLRSTLKKRKGNLRLINPQSRVKSTLDITRLSVLFGLPMDNTTNY